MNAHDLIGSCVASVETANVEWFSSEERRGWWNLFRSWKTGHERSLPVILEVVGLCDGRGSGEFGSYGLYVGWQEQGIYGSRTLGKPW